MTKLLTLQRSFSGYNMEFEGITLQNYVPRHNTNVMHFWKDAAKEIERKSSHESSESMKKRKLDLPTFPRATSKRNLLFAVPKQ